MTTKVIIPRDMGKTIKFGEDKLWNVNIGNTLKVNADGSVDVKDDLLGGKTSTEFRQVRNLDTDIAEDGFVPFWGVMGSYAGGAAVQGLPSNMGRSSMTTEGTSAGAFPTNPRLTASNQLAFVGYQISKYNSIEQRIAVKQGTQSLGAWVRVGRAQYPNGYGTVVWNKWERDTVPDGVFITRNDPVGGLEYQEDPGVLVIKRETDEENFRSSYGGAFANFSNHLGVSSDGVYSGPLAQKYFRQIYVDNTNGDTDQPSDFDNLNTSKKGTRENPFKSLEVLTYIPATTRCIIYLKATGKPYRISAGRARNADNIGVRVFTTYNDGALDSDIDNYKKGVLFNETHFRGFADYPRAVVQYAVSKDPDTGVFAQSVFEASRGGTLIFENIDFDLKAAEYPADLPKNKYYWSIVSNNGGTVVFNFCRFRLDAYDSNAKDIYGGIGRTSGMFTMGGGFKFNACKFDLPSNLPAANHMLQVGVGAAIEVVDNVIDPDNIPTKYASQKATYYVGNAATTLATRIKNTQQVNHGVLTNFNVPSTI